MYHYVRFSDSEYPNFKNLHVEDFEKQLDYFEENFGFVAKEDFLSSLKTGKTPNGVVLTFDDGLRDHYDYVFPILKRRGLWGIFYITTGVFKRSKILDVHRTHLLLGRFDSKTIYNVLHGLVDDTILAFGSNKDYQELTYKFQDNDDYTKIIKRILNYYILPEKREVMLDQLMDHFFGDKESELFEEFYLNIPQIKEMHDNGMLIGSHSDSHSVMANLSLEQQEKEIIDSFRFLNEKLGGFSTRTFCYPYGGFHTFNPETEVLLKKHDCLFSFNVESRDIDSNDLLNRQQALPRYDCNEFPFGKCRN